MEERKADRTISAVIFHRIHVFFYEIWYENEGGLCVLMKKQSVRGGGA